jgi:hypothetical protein
MTDTFDTLVESASRDGSRQYARWDAALFREVCDGPARALWESLAKRPRADEALVAYLQLVGEAVGAGHLRRGEPNFLAFCLLKLVPEGLGRVRPDARLALLAKVWNLGEGLLREPPWIDRYVTAAAAGLDDLAGVEGFLVRTLEPALAPTKASSWAGPFELALLDTRPLSEEFLPGTMHLAAPAVLCVHDRRQAGVQAGVFLRPGRESRLIGLTPCLGPYAEAKGLPRYVVEDRKLRVGGNNVELPLLRRHQAAVLTPAGFAVVSAVDSQRLWVVESAA